MDIHPLALKKAILKGCQNYLAALNDKTSLRQMAGFFHGRLGRLRAQRAHAYASSNEMNDKTEQSILVALAIALFDSSSKGLTSYIAEQLIQGEYKIICNDGNHQPTLRPTNTLSSEAISAEVLQNMTFMDELLEPQAKSSLGTTVVLNKRYAIHWLLNQIRLTQPLEGSIQDIQRNLENTSSNQVAPAPQNENIALEDIYSKPPF